MSNIKETNHGNNDVMKTFYIADKFADLCDAIEATGRSLSGESRMNFFQKANNMYMTEADFMMFVEEFTGDLYAEDYNAIVEALGEFREVMSA
jgi:hypothetical protein